VAGSLFLEMHWAVFVVGFGAGWYPFRIAVCPVHGGGPETL